MNIKSLICDHCNSEFETTPGIWRRRRSNKKRLGKKHYCSSNCRLLDRGHGISEEVECLNCKKMFYKSHNQLKKHPKSFCCKSCAATYNNTHKTKGNRRSKLEMWVEGQLTTLYPELHILYSDKTAINSELDIYIPSLSLAFELNGIFHYEPIYGKSKLNQIQNNDNRKFQACIEHNIELCIIDTSSQKYFKENSSKKYLDIITHLVTIKMASKADYVEVV